MLLIIRKSEELRRILRLCRPNGPGIEPRRIICRNDISLKGPVPESPDPQPYISIYAPDLSF